MFDKKELHSQFPAVELPTEAEVKKLAQETMALAIEEGKDIKDLIALYFVGHRVLEENGIELDNPAYKLYEEMLHKELASFI
ncbi:MAG: hypothetical protein WCI52_01675 [bacterium]